MENINLYKVILENFYASSYRLRDVNNLTYDLENLGQNHVVEKRDLRRSMVNINLYNNCIGALFASSHRIPDIIYLNISRNFVILKI